MNNCSLKDSFFSSLSFLTLIKPRVKYKFNPCAATYTFALTGLFIGAGLVLINHTLGTVAPVIMTVYLALITGFLHLDGLADTFDGFFSHRTKRKEILDIMSDSRIGTMGAISIILCLLTKFYAFTGVNSYLLLLAIPALSRGVASLIMVYLPYAKEKGLGHDFSETNNYKKYIQLIPVEILILMSGLLNFMFINLVMIALVLLLSMWFKSKIGGYTGDTIGAFIEISEAVLFLLIMLLK